MERMRFDAKSANILRRLRQNSGLSQYELCRMLSVSQGTVSNWERGEHDIDNDSLLKLSEYFGVSTDYILKGEMAQSSPLPKMTEGRKSDLLHLVDTFNETEASLLYDFAQLLLRTRLLHQGSGHPPQDSK